MPRNEYHDFLAEFVVLIFLRRVKRCDPNAKTVFWFQACSANPISISIKNEVEKIMKSVALQKFFGSLYWISYVLSCQLIWDALSRQFAKSDCFCNFFCDKDGDLQKHRRQFIQRQSATVTDHILDLFDKFINHN